MVEVDFEDLKNALEFVGANPMGDEEAFICLKTGVIYWVSSELDLEVEIPEDIYNDELYLAVPDKKYLGLGQDIVMAFMDEALPDDYNTVAAYFRKKGAYRRFKDLLDERDKLEAWFAFESRATDSALLAWCEENGIQPTNLPASA